MPPPSSDPVAEFKRLVEALPAGGGGVELLLRQMVPEKAALLRLCAVPHQFDPEILRVLVPELDTEKARERCAEFSRLAIVVGAEGRLALHDQAREHLFRCWLEPQNRDTFARASSALAEWFSRLGQEAVGERLEELNNQRMFHLLGWDQAAGFAEFERFFAEARQGFRLSRCAALIRLVEEYRPVLESEHRLRLDYQAGKLAADRRDLDRAQALFESILADPQVTEALRIKALNRLGQVAAARHAWPQAIARYREALDLAAGSGFDHPTHGILHDLATAYRESDALVAAEHMLKQAIAGAGRADSTSDLAACYNSLGILHLKRGDVEPAIEAYGRCLECLERAGERFRMAQVLNNLGMAFVRHGDLGRGERHLRESLEIKREAGDSMGQASTLNNLVEVLRRQGRTLEALETCVEAIGLFEAMHATLQAGVAYLNLGQTHRESGRADLARQAYGEAMVRFRACAAEDQIEATERAVAALGRKGGLPWWAWTVMVFGILFIVLAVIGLLVKDMEFGREHFTFSADNRRWAVGSQGFDGWTLDVDGARFGPYEELLPGTPLFSPDGRRLAYAARLGDAWFVVLDGAKLRQHDSIVTGSLAFSPDGGRFAYAARDGGRYRIFTDGESGPPFDEIFPETVIFSPDGRHLSYRARTGDHRTLVLDGEPGPPFDRISIAPWVFSPDSRRVAYSAQRGEKHVMVVDGEEGPAYDTIYVGAPVFSPDSRRVAYVARRGAEVFLVVDGQEGPAYDDIVVGPSLFGPDSRRITYGAMKAGRLVVVIDGKEREAFEAILEGTPRFGPDGARVVYGALRGGKWIVVEDGSESPAWDGILRNTPQFSSDGRRLAYGALRDGKGRIVVDGVEGSSYDGVLIGPSLFSPDGRHVAYGASDGTDWFAVVDGKPGRRFEKVGAVVFDGANRVRYLAYTEKEGLRVVEESIEGPTDEGVPAAATNTSARRD